MQKRETRMAWLFLLPSLSGVIIFVLLPFADAVIRSFYEAIGGRFVGLDNYKEVLNNKAFQMAVKNTGRFIVTCIPLLLVVSLFISILILKYKNMEAFFKTSFLIPLAIPIASIVLLWNVFFHENGILNNLIVIFGVHKIDWMHSSNAFYVLVISYIWKNTGYDMVLWLAGLCGISTSLYEAASIDGAGTWEKFKYITVPGLIPTVFITVVLSLVNSFKVFREAYLVAGNYPHNSIYMLQHLFNNWFVSLEIQKICAAAVMLAIVMLCFILLLQWLDNKGEGDTD